MSQSLRIVFAGTPEFAGKHLKNLIDFVAASRHELIAVYTQPDRPSGRGRKIQSSPVKLIAKKYDILVYQPTNITLFNCTSSIKNISTRFDNSSSLRIDFTSESIRYT